jgi:hypothetical protein
MSTRTRFPAEGGCTCRSVRYRLATEPLFVHCCHCRWCQRETGSAFAINALIESNRVDVLSGHPEPVATPSNSGRGQTIARCPHCRIALWSHYAGGGPAFSFVRVGTLDTPDLLPPDIHIFTSSKQRWVVLPKGVPAMPEYYDRNDHWTPESLERRGVLLATLAARDSIV